MSCYKALNKQEYSNNEFSIVPIRYEDRMDIMKWRNEQVYHLRQDKPLTKTNQENYFKKVVNKLFDEEKPNQLLFSYLQDDLCIGYGGLVHINWIDKNAEISFVMETKLEKEHFSKHWKMFLKLIEQVAFKEVKLYKIFTFAFDLRPKLYLALEESGYKLEARLGDHCIIDEKYMDVVIHSKVNKSR